jgi:lysophospholipase L1-like esterase
MSRYLPNLPKAIAATLVAVLIFAVIEVALQARAYLRTGQSVFMKLKGESAYVFNEDLGFPLLRPNHVTGGDRQKIVSNSFGFRSPEIPLQRDPDEFRIAVLGASTVMGAYAANNELTFPALLQAELRKRQPSRSINVINAGIVGRGLRQQGILLDRLLSKFQPDLVLVYPGFNDFGRYCPRSAGAERRAQPLVTVDLPAWLLSVELLLKNTVALRASTTKSGPVVDAEALDISRFRGDFESLLEIGRKHALSIVVLRNARSYSREQTLDVQQRLSETARFYNPCFDINGLHTLYERHNELMSEVAALHRVPVLPLDKVLPSGPEYFADSSHFSERGERFVARWLADYVVESVLAGGDKRP